MAHISDERGGRWGHLDGRPPPRGEAGAWPLHLESAYLPSPLHLSPDAPGAHAVQLFAGGELDREALRAHLLADPNVRDVLSGARVPSTRLAPRLHRVALTRLRAPGDLGRRYAITGVDLRDGLTLVESRHGDRHHLELDGVLVPLRPRAPRPPSTDPIDR